MSSHAGTSNSSRQEPGKAERREFVAGAKVAATFAAAAPLLAFAVAALQNLWFLAREAALVQVAAHWLLAGVALVVAALISRSLWNGIRDGRIAPFQLILFSVLPCWVIGEVAGQYLALEALRSGYGGPWGHAEASTLRLAGQIFASSLTGSVSFGLAIASFLWRKPGRRLSGLLFAWASLVPFVVFVLWAVIAGQIESPQVRASLLGYALVSLPFVLGLAGAALGDPHHPHPRPDWLVGVAVAALVAFAAAAVVASGQVLIDAELKLGSADGLVTAPAPASADPARVLGFGLLGLVLAAIPAVVFARRLEQLPGARGWLLLAAPAVLAATAIAFGGSPSADGLAEPYLQRLNLLWAFLLVTPLVLWGLCRIAGPEHVSLTGNGLLLAAALFALQAVALRPGLLLIEDYIAHASPPPAADHGMNVEVPPEGATAEPVSPLEDLSYVEEGDAEGGVPGAFIGGVASPLVSDSVAADPNAELSPAIPALVTWKTLQAQLTSSHALNPPPELLASAPRHVVIVKLGVDASGRVTRTELVKSSGNPELDEYTTSALRQWLFRPWMHQGKAVEVESAVTLVFVR